MRRAENTNIEKSALFNCCRSMSVPNTQLQSNFSRRLSRGGPVGDFYWPTPTTCRQDKSEW